MRVSGAGFGSTPRQLRATDFGCELPAADDLMDGPDGQRQQVLCSPGSVAPALLTNGFLGLRPGLAENV